MIKAKIIKLKMLIIFLLLIGSGFSEKDISKKEFILSGLKYHLSLIKDAHVRYTSGSGNLVAEIEWKYKPGEGREYMNILMEEKSTGKKKILQVSLDYFLQKGTTVATFYEGSKLSDWIKKEGEILESENIWRFTNRSISKIPPSSLIWLLWPGVTIEEVLSDPNAKIISEKEFVEGDECFVIYLPKFSRFASSEKELPEKWRYSGGYKIWIAKEKGFFPKKIEIWSSNKINEPFVVFSSIELKNFGENIWFPTKVIFFFPISKHPKETVIEYRDIRINQGLEDKEFELTFEPGTEVYDERTGVSFMVPKK
ncbi:MAG: hypothetical protein NC827_07275 [Candidatus Omnitrophica bacterium]|nr:hypothetical protein [Candidatus Omnitrophota bacterium]